MIKQDHCDCCGGNTFIGFSHSYDNGYCKKCGNIFTYSWNGCKPFSEDKTCPKCGAFDEVETEHHIESHIQMIKMLRNTDIMTEKGKKSAIKDINELNRIRREFDKYNNKKEGKRQKDYEKECEEHKKRMNKN